MLRVTKQQLLNEVDQLRNALERERTARLSMEAEMAALRKVAYTPTTDRRALLAAAKEQAMRTGRMVKV